jgi:hypothetical protein
MKSRVNSILKKDRKHLESLLSLIIICGLFTTVPLLGQSTVKIKNRYRANSFIQEKSNGLTSGPIGSNSASAIWAMEPVTGANFVRLRNTATSDHYIHVEKGHVESSAVPAGYRTSHWIFEPVANTNYVRIRNRFRKDQYLHLEKGPIESSAVPAGYWTSHWEIIRDAGDAPDFDNWNFEKGLRGWSKEGTAFNNQPTYGDNVLTERALTQMEYNKGGLGGNFWKEMASPIGHKGDYWIGTFENHPSPNSKLGQTQGNAPIGRLVSPEFQIKKKYCDFLIGGGSESNINSLRVELQVKAANGSWSAVAVASPARNREQMYRHVFNLAQYSGKSGRIAIVDESTAGHINVDDFRFFDELPKYISMTDMTTGKRYSLDEDAAVWGFADTHAHPTSQEGFGARTLIGNPAVSLGETYNGVACAALHLANPFVIAADPHLVGMGYPDFVGFPRFNSKTHQQQHIDFLKRAWQGGLRLYCALAVNNMYLPTRAVGTFKDGRALDDETVVFRELDLMKQIAASQSSWMEIAKTPQEARRIIHEGKLAVVLGVEVDNFGNFKSPNYIWCNSNLMIK